MHAAADGYEAYLLLVIQMKDVRYFEPNRETHPEFGETLKAAADAGVHILAYDCAITEDSIKICDPITGKIIAKETICLKTLRNPLLKMVR